MSLEPTAPRPGLHGGRRKAHNRSAIPGPAIRPALHGEVSCVHGVNGRKTIIEGIEKETMLRRAGRLGATAALLGERTSLRPRPGSHDPMPVGASRSFVAHVP